jgi:hypothetical protein
MLEQSDGAKRILRHFQKQGYGPATYELPAKLRELFPGDDEQGEIAQAELERLGLAVLGPPPHAAAEHGIRTMALTRAGARRAAEVTD